MKALKNTRNKNVIKFGYPDIEAFLVKETYIEYKFMLLFQDLWKFLVKITSFFFQIH